jgi:RNAse (barnase) inhibitor barstar
MSYVTNYILTCFEDWNDTKADELNALLDVLSKDLETPIAFVRVDRGTSMEVQVYVGATNYVYARDIAEQMRRVNWEHPEYVQLFVKDQHDERFSEYDWAKRTRSVPP